MGYGHPDRLLAGLNYRQQRQIEIYAGLEPIGGMIGVSEPAAAEPEPPDGAAMFERVKLMLGAKEEG